MTTHTLPEDNAVANFIEKIPFPEKTKEGWLKSIRSVGLNEELAETIHEKLAKMPAKENEDENSRGREVAEFANLIKRWRMAKNKNQFHSHR